MAKNRTNSKLIITNAVLFVLVIGMFALLMSQVIKPESEPVAAQLQTEAAEPAIVVDKNDPNLVLVNKDNSVGEDYAPEELVYIDASMRAEDRAPQYQRMQPEAAEAFEALVNGAEADGQTIKVTTAYRPYSYQADLYYYYLAVKGEEWTEKYSAPPGTSEHQTGLAADVSCPSINYELDSSFGETEEGNWLAQHAPEYGFILRYQEGKEDITGYAYEPWHIRYVGKEAAEVITEKGLTLEEFLEQY